MQEEEGLVRRAGRAPRESGGRELLKEAGEELALDRGLAHPPRQEAGKGGRKKISLQVARDRAQEVKEVPVWWLLFSLLSRQEVVGGQNGKSV